MSERGHDKYSRICDGEGYKGTIMYVGPVAGARNKSDTWLGVVWDKPGRGKNDGSCFDEDGVQHRYFQCLPGCGSFVNPSKVSKGC